MIRSTLARRLVVGMSILMLLLCQTAGAALACIAPPAAIQVAATEFAMPCHTYAQDADRGIPAGGSQDRCPARDASLETAKVNIPAVDRLALPVLTVAPPAAATTITAPHEHILACAAPPPLNLIYCRLLI